MVTNSLEREFHAANGKAQHAPTNHPVFALFEGAGKRDFFPPCSQCVPITQSVPNSTGFYPIWFAQSSTPLSISKKGILYGSTFVSILQLGVQRGAFIGGMPNVPKKIGSFKTTRKSCNCTHDLIYLWKQGCLFCFVCTDEIHQDASDRIPGLFGKLSRTRGASAWFHAIWTCIAKVLEYWMISSLKIKLNGSWKFLRNWNMPLVLLERSWWGGFYGIYLVRFGFRMWKKLI